MLDAIRDEPGCCTDSISRRGFVGAVAGLGAVAIAGDTLVAQASAPTSRRIADLKDVYDVAPGLTYLNHGSSGCMPRPVLERMHALLNERESNPWAHVYGKDWDDDLEVSRSMLSAYINCDPTEIAFTENTAEGMLTLASGLPLGDGDEVLYSSINHFSAADCWLRWSRALGYSVREFEFPIADAPSLSPEDVVELHVEQITDRTRVLVLPHVDNFVGLNHPIKEIARGARERGVEFVVVDGAQALGMLPVNLEEWGIDFYAGSAHKWLQTPKTSGLLWVPEQHFESLAQIWKIRNDRDSATVYEQNTTLNHAPWICIADALRFRALIDDNERRSHLMRLRAHAMQRADASDRLVWVSPRHEDCASSLFSIRIDGADHTEALTRLREDFGVIARRFQSDGFTGIRLSPNIPNSIDDIDTAFDAMLAVS
jgi:isopenicillin-N epimerase